MTFEEIEHVATAFFETEDCVRGWAREPEKLKAPFRAAAMVAINTIDRLDRLPTVPSTTTDHFEAVMVGPDHVYSYADAVFCHLLGRRNLVGQSVRAAFPEVVGLGYFELLDQVFRTGVPFAGEALPLQVIGDDRRPKEHLLNLTYSPIVNPGTHSVSGILVRGAKVQTN
jgi:hypothetical protein